MNQWIEVWWQDDDDQEGEWFKAQIKGIVDEGYEVQYQDKSYEVVTADIMRPLESSADVRNEAAR